MYDEKELQRIRFVSRRYLQLRGLGLVAIGVSATVAMSGYFLLGNEGEEAFYIAVAAVFAMVIPAMMWVERFYASTYGRVAPSAAEWHPALIIGLVAGLGSFLNNMVPNGPMLLPFVMNGVLFLWTAVRDWSFRSYHLVTAAACAFGVVLLVAPGLAPDRWTAAAAGYLVLGVTCIPVGFLDHHLIVTTMKRPALDAATDET